MASKTNSSAGSGTLAVFFIFVFAFFAVALLPAFIAQVSAADADGLYKEADKAIRNSQRAMFNGKMEESRELLNKAGELIEQIKAADPGDSRLKTLESKYAKQAGDLDRRTPKDMHQRLPLQPFQPHPRPRLPRQLRRFRRRRLRPLRPNRQPKTPSCPAASPIASGKSIKSSRGRTAC